THKPIVTSTSFLDVQENHDEPEYSAVQTKSSSVVADLISGTPSLLELGKQAAMKAEREAIERVLTQTKGNRRQAANTLQLRDSQSCGQVNASWFITKEAVQHSNDLQPPKFLY